MIARTAIRLLSTEADHLAVWPVATIRAFAGKIQLALLHRYRPERHYMRGPGPRWHAKHGPSA
jgi:hypothetical protein